MKLTHKIWLGIIFIFFILIIFSMRSWAQFSQFPLNYQLPVQTYTAVNTPTTGNNISGSGAIYHILTWSIVGGTVSGCQLSVDNATVAISGPFTVGAVITAQTCTGNGSFISTAFVGTFVRINLSTFTVATGNPSLIVTLTGTSSNPNGVMGIGTQGQPLTNINGSTGYLTSPMFLDARSFDVTPTSPTSPCPDMATAAGAPSVINGNQGSIPINALGFVNQIIPCTVNPLFNDKNGQTYISGGLWEVEDTWALQGGTAGLINIAGTGRGANSGTGNTVLQNELGMTLAQMGLVSVSVANPAIVTGTAGTNGQIGAAFNPAWVGLNFCIGTVCQVITAVSSTASANGLPCTASCTMTLTTSWAGTTGGNQFFKIGNPGTVSCTNAAPPVCTGANGTAFNAAWVGTTFNAGPLNNPGVLCVSGGLNFPCVVASVGGVASLTLGTGINGLTAATGLVNASTSAGQAVAANSLYTLGSVFGPTFMFGQGNNPITQAFLIYGSGLSWVTDTCNYSNAMSPTSGIFNPEGEEQNYVEHAEINLCGNAIDWGGGGNYSHAQNSGWVKDVEELGGTVTVPNPVGVTVNSVSSGALISAAPFQEAIATFILASPPVPNIGRGDLAICPGVAPGTGTTVYAGNWLVMDNPALNIFTAKVKTNVVNDSQATIGGTCTFYKVPALLRGGAAAHTRGFINTTFNNANFNYAGNKPVYAGTAASTNLSTDFEIAGNCGWVGNIFAQGADVGLTIGEGGNTRGCVLTNIWATAQGPGTTGTVISNQFKTVNVDILGLWASGNSVAPTNTLVDNVNTNTFPFSQPNFEIGFYFLDGGPASGSAGGGFPISDATCGAVATCNNGIFMNQTDGIVLYKGGTTAQAQLFPNGNLALNNHLNQTATGKYAGSCTMAGGTTCTFSIGAAYVSTPLAFASVQNAAPTTFQGSCALSATTVTVTASAGNSNLWACLLVGNPN